MAVATYTASGNKATTAAQLDASVFAVMPENDDLLKLAYDAYLANGRSNHAVVKTRGLVSGGGRKPWKQKGTGNARVGSTRSPIWRSGGIVFGPTGQENYSKQINTKAKRQAIRQALSMAANENKLTVIESLTSKEGKTADLVATLTKIGASRRILLVVADKTNELVRASRNVANIKLIQPTYINVYDAVNADTIVFTADALQATTGWLSGGAK